jgi:hypothetical protein
MITLHAAVDLNSDGFSDVWQLKYPGAALVPSEDQDGDGQSNAAEATIGTDPRDPKSTIRISSIHWENQQVTVTWPSIAGKRYSMEWSPTPAGPTWTDTGAAFSGTGADLMAIVPSATPNRFFRVRIFDTDTDADGVTDWEEMQVGYDPGTNPQNDLARLTTALQSRRSSPWPRMIRMLPSPPSQLPRITCSCPPASFFRSRSMR